MLIEIKNLHAYKDDKPILKGLNLSIPQGEIHAIMGPNGAGKSTLAAVLAGKEDFTVTEGEVLFNGINILELEADERAKMGLFLAFQYPVEIPGVSNSVFLRAAVNAVRTYQNKENLSAKAFLEMAREKAKLVKLHPDFLSRFVNEGFSGGEKKKNEIFQMAMLEPHFAVLDETDSGLDIDALKDVAEGVNALRDKERSFLLITHYQRLLDYIVPDVVHVLMDGKIVKTGDKNLALELEKKGYDWLK